MYNLAISIVRIGMHLVCYLAAILLLGIPGFARILNEDAVSTLTYMRESAVLYAYQQAEKATTFYACQPVAHWETILQGTMGGVLELAQDPVMIVLVVVASIIAAGIRYGLSLYALRTQQSGAADKTRKYLVGVSVVSIQVLTRAAGLIGERWEWLQPYRDQLMERLIDALETLLSSLL
ncbi:hypothetical protein HMPREF2942_00390 [Rothia sp. HMSC071C12]|uniref:hypothetical protein n=1 Tax=Rothia sp. HMSC071C12 TaxID=1739446 RepID=UPI0008A12DEE|nr:hypothetical protein [Rothia sp. HMSC071C12]OFQ33122.1 hypothetical protein HMPREF2942_00390 [Rothia sp. HMSC071C12]